MNLEKAQEIKMICDKIEEKAQKIRELENCSYIEIKVVKNPFFEEIEETHKIFKESRAYKHIIQAYKEDRNALIRKLNEMD